MKTAIGRDRLFYIDDVRSLAIFLVVLLHASVTYSGLGGWYLIENKSDSLDPLSLIAFGLFNSFTQAWFMGILFFFAGFFAADALARKGGARFVRDRLLRLGIPLAGYVLVINPLMMYFLAYPEECRKAGGFFSLYVFRYLGSGMALGSTGPLWFAETLLIFSLAYAAVMKLLACFAKVPSGAAGAAGALRADEPNTPPSVHALLGLVALIAVTAFAVRIIYPIGFSWLNLQFCFFPSYIALFVLGINALRGDWLSRIMGKRSIRWFWAALGIGIPGWMALMVSGGALSGNLDGFWGGFTWQSAGYCLWESFTAVAMSIGLTALFANRKRGPGQGALSAFFARNSFSVYVFHPVFLIGLTRLARAWSLVPLAKAAVIGTSAFIATILFAELVIRRVPFIRKYF
ncbi:MAG TPA: acyltransferase family protein [Treponemataceae bacterium]|nr:acyltransferase family protein [Treponemataceae bacterium]